MSNFASSNVKLTFISDNGLSQLSRQSFRISVAQLALLFLLRGADITSRLG
jgi:hypothetical protein